MSPQLVEALAQLGVAAVVFGFAFMVFYKMHKAAMEDAKNREEQHAKERTEFREGFENQSKRVESAINNLARSINDKRM